MSEMPRSFVPVDEGSHFPIQNLPYGVARPRAGGPPRVVTAIGEHVLDLSVIESAGHFREADLPEGTFAGETLNVRSDSSVSWKRPAQPLFGSRIDPEME